MNKKEIRNKFKEEVFNRDKFTCQVCFNRKSISELDAHHITDRNEMPNGGYVIENGITVCKNNCHLKVEKFHISDNKEWEENLHPDDLYQIINSNYELAFEKSLLI